ncbi:MAG: hypothetical protein M0R74_10190 [Dehalococcoidia bacterium]|nr:hypothetical protein [Dehalococcoidia bacterium]
MTAVNKQVFRYGTPTYVDLIVAYNQAVKVGEIMEIPAGGGLSTPIDNAADNASLFAVADEAHAALAADDGKTHHLRAILPNPSCVFEFPVDGTPNLVVGSGLSMKDSQTLKLAATDHVAVAVEPKTAATSVKCVFLVPPLLGGAAQDTSFTSAS